MSKLTIPEPDNPVTGYPVDSGKRHREPLYIHTFPGKLINSWTDKRTNVKKTNIDEREKFYLHQGRSRQDENIRHFLVRNMFGFEKII